MNQYYNHDMQHIELYKFKKRHKKQSVDFLFLF